MRLYGMNTVVIESKIRGDWMCVIVQQSLAILLSP